MELEKEEEEEEEGRRRRGGGEGGGCLQRLWGPLSSGTPPLSWAAKAVAWKPFALSKTVISTESTGPVDPVESGPTSPSGSVGGEPLSVVKHEGHCPCSVPSPHVRQQAPGRRHPRRGKGSPAPPSAAAPPPAPAPGSAPGPGPGVLPMLPGRPPLPCPGSEVLGVVKDERELGAHPGRPRSRRRQPQGATAPSEPPLPPTLPPPPLSPSLPLPHPTPLPPPLPPPGALRPPQRRVGRYRVSPWAHPGAPPRGVPPPGRLRPRQCSDDAWQRPRGTGHWGGMRQDPRLGMQRKPPRPRPGGHWGGPGGSRHL